MQYHATLNRREKSSLCLSFSAEYGRESDMVETLLEVRNLSKTTFRYRTGSPPDRRRRETIKLYASVSVRLW